MPVELTAGDDGKRILLQGVVSAEEVDQLHELLRDNPGAVIDLSLCEHLHTAALQLVIISRHTIGVPPESSFWRHFFKNGGRAHEDSSAG